jgi:hypothetical protein
MSDDYLWDQSGEPDAETVRLERLLGRLRYSGAGEFRSGGLARRRTVIGLAAAALVAALAAPALLDRGRATNWRMADGRSVRVGQTIETRAANTTIQSGDTGEVTIDRGSRFRLVRASDREQRFDLETGAIHAFIWAPPGKFVVDTPSSKTIDLGCRYTLEVSSGGTGLLTVELGWVAFERNKVESFIPAGAACVTRPGKGPGTPYFEDASPALIGALARFDASGDGTALDAALASARRRDALTLWHLMVRSRGDARGKAYDRLSALVALPPTASRNRVLQGDGVAIDAAWNALGLGETSWWREWKRQW